MGQHPTDVVVVGLGPGGEYAAGELARAGLRVVGIEARLVGGECPYYGCVPSKMMIAAAGVLAQARRVSALAGAAEVNASWAPVAARIAQEATDGWDDSTARARLEAAGVQVVRGRGRLTGPGRVEVGEDTFVATRGIVLNTGTEPALPPIDGLAGTSYWTNREIVRLQQLPASLAVIGGGAIGVELAQALARFGVQVSLIEAADRLLAAEEPEASARVVAALAADGVRIRVGEQVRHVDEVDGRFRVAVGDVDVVADRLLVATGRRNNLADLGLDTIGLDPAAPALDPDEWMRVADRVWAIGDITGKGAFTHMSMYQADLVVRDLLGRGGPSADYRAVSRVTFTDPEVASVGLTEAQARERGGRIRVGVAADLGARGWIAGAEGMVKVVADGSTLVGATVVGPAAGEVLAMLTTAVHARIPVSTLRHLHLAYPTFHRAVGTALADLG